MELNLKTPTKEEIDKQRQALIEAVRRAAYAVRSAEQRHFYASDQLAVFMLRYGTGKPAKTHLVCPTCGGAYWNAGIKTPAGMVCGLCGH